MPSTKRMPSGEIWCLPLIRLRLKSSVRSERILHSGVSLEFGSWNLGEGRANVQDLVVMFENFTNWLEVQALKTGPLVAGKFYSVVLESPLAIL